MAPYEIIFVVGVAFASGVFIGSFLEHVWHAGRDDFKEGRGLYHKGE